jgi:HAD superfamily hydrolase (TIGR01509 family)
MSIINTVVFDLAEVCVHGLIGLEEQISAHTGLPTPRFVEFIDFEQMAAVFEGKYSEDEYLALLIKSGDLEIDVASLKKIIREHFQEIPGTKEVIQGLKKQGYKLGLLSDHVMEWIQYIENKHDFVDLFDARYYSFNFGCTKKKPEFFKQALMGLKANPDQVLYIDDLVQNLEVAKKAGIAYVHHFVSVEKLRRDLPCYGIYLY